MFTALVEWGRTPYWRWRSLFRAAVAAGHRVLWADQFDEFRSAPDLATHPARLLRRLREIDEGIHVLSSPLQVRRGEGLTVRTVNRLVLSEVNAAIDRLRFTDPVLWIGGPKAGVSSGRSTSASSRTTARTTWSGWARRRTW